jgi:hypothetical protein
MKTCTTIERILIIKILNLRNFSELVVREKEVNTWTEILF